MSNTNTEKTLRDRYFDNEIFCVGDLVEDVATHEQIKILDRGANYVTVATSTGIVKKWLNEVTDKITETTTKIQTPKEVDFELLESGQIKLFGYETKNFDAGLSELVIEQFDEFTDLYSKHQIIKCLDFALQESDQDQVYSLLQKVESFYTKQSISAPLIVEALKNDTERTRIAEILASVAGIKPEKSNSKTVTESIKALREKYQTRQQWEVINPFLKLAYSVGLTGAMQNLPFRFSDVSEETLIDDITLEAIEDNLDLMVEDLDFDDINETFTESEFDELSEGLSIETRMALSRKLKQHAPVLDVKRARAMTRSASSDVLMNRARRLAETMLKRRMFHKPATDMSRQEKERFEAGAGKRKALVARLAQKLVVKVRMLQTDRLHHQATPVSHHSNVNAAVVGGAN